MIILAAHVNPDGMELVSDWYMRNPDPKQRSTDSLPRLYQKYVGHDNNRDFYMMNQPESVNINRHAVSRVVPADRLQPSPDRPDRHGDVLAAVPRSVQLSTYDPLVVEHARPGRRGDAHAIRRRRQAGRDDAARARTTRRGGTAACGRCPTSTTRSACSPRRSATRRRRRSASCPTALLPDGDLPLPIDAAGVALPPVDRLLDHRELRGARLRAALSRDAALQHLRDGQELHRAAAAPTPGRCIRGASPR